MKLMLKNARKFSTANIPKVCIVGAGPAGFYAAQQLLKKNDILKVDILEKLPLPFGLVRFGVAPDHPEVKNVINTFHKTATNPRLQFVGNVFVGKDVSVEKLQEMYNAVLLTYGAEEDKILGIPGENLKNVISGRRFVGWYNGVPADKHLEINLDAEDVTIFGQGNVAIDIARILLTPVDILKKTDITSYSLEKLSKSKVRRVNVIGRRGPLQAAFTIAELREMTKLDGCCVQWRPQDFNGVDKVLPTLARPRKRLTELMLKSLGESKINAEGVKEFRPIFFRGPCEILGSGSVAGLKLLINKLEGEDITKQWAVSTGQFEELPCDLLFRSIGYKSVKIDEFIPFDDQRGRVSNSGGKVKDNLYAAGWVATGPTGVILTTMTNAMQVGELISKGLATADTKPGFSELKQILNQKNIPIVSYSQWEKIDRVEKNRGEKLGKPREKIVDISEMLDIALQ